MTAPGLTFEVVRSAVTTPVRGDRGAMAILAARGPTERVVKVRSKAELEAVFGCPTPGMLGARAGRAFFDNGGRELHIARIRPVGGVSATGRLPLLNGLALGLRHSEPGAFGDAVRVRGSIRIVRRARGTVTSATEINLTDANDDDLGRLVRVGNEWRSVRSRAGTRLTVAPALPAGLGDVVLTLYARQYALHVEEAGRASVQIDVNPQSEASVRAALRGSPLTIDGAPPFGPRAYVDPSAHAELSGGLDGLSSGTVDDLARAFRDAFDRLDEVGNADIVLCPDLWSAVFVTKGVSRLALDATTARKLSIELVQRAAALADRVVLLDAPLTDAPPGRPVAGSELEAYKRELDGALGEARDFAAVYAPWVRTLTPELRHRGDETLIEPASAYVAGRIAQTSLARGAWIASGGATLDGVLGASRALGPDEVDQLASAGINPIVDEPDGTRLHGVRSLSWPDRTAWRHLSTRRLFNYLRRALLPVGRSYVFEANGPATWAQLRRDVESVLREMFARGAFAGSTPQDSFFVKVDAELNPEAARTNGVLTAHVGVAPATPLEFLVVRLVARRDGSGGLEEVAA